MMRTDRPISVLVVVESFGKDLYGVSTVLTQLISRTGSQVTWTVGTGLVGELPASPACEVVKLPFGSRATNYWSPEQTRSLSRLIQRANPDLVHVHGVYSALQRAAVRCARREGLPVLLSPHGMLSPWLRGRAGSWRRVSRDLVWIVLIRPVLARADYLHAITQQESVDLAREFPALPQMRVPNAIDLEGHEFRPRQNRDLDRYFLFLGRIHPVKGVQLLLQAFAQTRARQEFKLVLAGPVWDADYYQKVLAHIAELGLGSQVILEGPAFGDRKMALLRGAWSLVLPSFSEVIGVVNLEAGACYTPSITTYNTGLLDWESGGGLLVDPEVGSLAAALERAAGWSLGERLQRGRDSRRLVRRRYSVRVIRDRWLDVYRQILEEHCNAKP